MITFESLVRAEVARSMELHGEFHSAHEAYAVILEELDEFWDQVRLKVSERDDPKMLEELVQIAAMAQKAADCLGLI